MHFLASFCTLHWSVFTFLKLSKKNLAIVFRIPTEARRRLLPPSRVCLPSVVRRHQPTNLEHRDTGTPSYSSRVCQNSLSRSSTALEREELDKKQSRWIVLLESLCASFCYLLVCCHGCGLVVFLLAVFQVVYLFFWLPCIARELPWVKVRVSYCFLITERCAAGNRHSCLLRKFEDFCWSSQQIKGCKNKHFSRSFANCSVSLMWHRWVTCRWRVWCVSYARVFN